MTIIYSAAPGSASNTLKKKLEVILNCEAKKVKSSAGIGHLTVNISPVNIILRKLHLNMLLKQPKLIYGHIFPSKRNMTLLKRHHNITDIIVSYRCIYDQLNYFYKWQKYKSKGPLSFQDDTASKIKGHFSSDDYNIDLNLLLLLNFYKYWFYLIQNNLVENLTLISFNEIISNNNSYQNKILSIVKNKVAIQGQIELESKIEVNVYKKEKFEINPRHNKMIEDFISFNKNIDFSLIKN